MAHSTEILQVTKLETHAVIVTFTDGILAQYTSAELLALRPERETAPQIKPWRGPLW